MYLGNHAVVPHIGISINGLWLGFGHIESGEDVHYQAHVGTGHLTVAVHVGGSIGAQASEHVDDLGHVGAGDRAVAVHVAHDGRRRQPTQGYHEYCRE